MCHLLDTSTWFLKPWVPPKAVPTTQQSLRSNIQKFCMVSNFLASILPPGLSHSLLTCSPEISNTVETKGKWLCPAKPYTRLPTCLPSHASLSSSPEGNQALSFIFANLHRTLRIRLFFPTNRPPNALPYVPWTFNDIIFIWFDST